MCHARHWIHRTLTHGRASWLALATLVEVAAGHHGAAIGYLSAADRARVADLVESWTGVGFDPDAVGTRAEAMSVQVPVLRGKQ